MNSLSTIIQHFVEDVTSPTPPTIPVPVVRPKKGLNGIERSFAIAIHGGAGVISPENTDASKYKCALESILQSVHSFVLSEPSITALDVAEYAVRLLEDNELFNAGRGSVFTAEGTHELEASIMDGHNMQCGSVSLITNIRNPVSVAKQVLLHSPHNYLIGKNAEELARQANLEFVDNHFFDTERRKNQLLTAQQSNVVALDHNVHIPIAPSSSQTQSQRELPTNAQVDTQTTTSTASASSKMDTVGCVCMLDGHVSAATSTGGMTNKACGRIGDSPIIGAGTFADDHTCAVSGTGIGELFQRHVVAYDISARIEYKKISLSQAVKETVYQRLPHDSGGVIAVDRFGHVVMEFNTIGMFRGVITSSGDSAVGIWQDLNAFTLVE